jgi:acetyl-CoA synthetase
MRPYAVVIVPELPITRSGKIHRRAVRAWLAGDDPGDLSSLENPRCESAIRAAGREAFGS